MSDIDIEVLTIALVKVTDAFDLFISDCRDEAGQRQAPSQKALMQARACLPSRCVNTLSSKANI